MGIQSGEDVVLRFEDSFTIQLVHSVKIICMYKVCANDFFMVIMLITLEKKVLKYYKKVTFLLKSMKGKRFCLRQKFCVVDFFCSTY